MIDDLILKFPNLDFSKFIYKSARSKSIVICKTHGEFETSRFDLLKAKYGCRECGKEYSNMSKRNNIKDYIKINRNDNNYKDIAINNLIKKYPNLNFNKFEYINSTNKSIVICPIHGEFESSYNNLIFNTISYGCKECMKTPNDIAIYKLKEKYPEYDYSESTYTSYNSDITIKCNKHGYFTKSYRLLMKPNTKIACPECSKHKTYSNENNNIINLLKTKYPKLDFSKFIYTNYNTKSTVICPIHGEFETSYAILMRPDYKTGCSKCRSLNPEESLNKLKNKFPELDFSKFTYTGRTNKSTVICKIHGEFESSYSILMDKRNKNGCRKCGCNYHLYGIDYLKNKFPNLIFDKFEYIDAKTKSTVICPEHGEFKAIYNHLFKDRTTIACPKCAKCGISGVEDEIYDFIKSIYNKKIIKNDRSTIKNEHSNRYLELDFYLPDINLAIEFNGSYWHSDKRIKKQKVGFNTAEEYHSYKSDKCKELNIELIHIDEQEWIENKNSVLNNIKNKIYVV